MALLHCINSRSNHPIMFKLVSKYEKNDTITCQSHNHTGKITPPPSSHIASAPSFTINKVEKLVLLSGKQKFGQRCIGWITTARLLICMTAFPLRTIHLLNTQCWLCSLTVRQEWILERKIREGGGQDFIAQYINMSKFTCTDTFFFFFFLLCLC